MRKILVLFTAVFVLSTVVFGQQETQEPQEAPKAELFAGYAYERANLQNYDPLSTESLNGETLQLTGYVNTNFGITADVTRATGSNVAQSGLTIVRTSYLFGPTYALRNNPSITPFVHVLFGTDRERSSSSYLPDIYSNSFAVDFGGGIDVILVPHMSVRVAEIDLMHTDHSGGENSFRYTGGVVFRF